MKTKGYYTEPSGLSYLWIIAITIAIIFILSKAGRCQDVPYQIVHYELLDSSMFYQEVSPMQPEYEDYIVFRFRFQAIWLQRRFCRAGHKRTIEEKKLRYKKEYHIKLEENDELKRFTNGRLIIPARIWYKVVYSYELND